ncbi:MAG: phosphoribosylaminoimidazolesuccinocarboxamide synthase [Deltaproteobacteria bacterium]|nr:MAG: phosphoribosylaminoimidazolesuccinocarboxamide synthase [Deltaproteobacteria bacterium]
MKAAPVFETNFPGLALLGRGKVRDIYDLGEQLLIVATDRISAYDVVMPTPIPDKGKILTKISAFWFGALAEVVDNHLVTVKVNEFPEQCLPYAEELEGRSMLVTKAEPLPVECIVRGYLSGSGWKDYQRHGSVCGITLPAGLLESSSLESPIFTPSTKAERGLHDENIDFATLGEKVGTSLAEKLRELSIALYKKGAAIAGQRGIIIADTKFEFGIVDDRLALIDEVLTPDSSRFWPADKYEPGRSQESFDKQYLRDYLDQSGWNHKPPAPSLPDEVVQNTRTRYLEALERLTQG